MWSFGVQLELKAAKEWVKAAMAWKKEAEAASSEADSNRSHAIIVGCLLETELENKPKKRKATSSPALDHKRKPGKKICSRMNSTDKDGIRGLLGCLRPSFFFTP